MYPRPHLSAPLLGVQYLLVLRPHDVEVAADDGDGQGQHHHARKHRDARDELPDVGGGHDVTVAGGTQRDLQRGWGELKVPEESDVGVNQKNQMLGCWGESEESEEWRGMQAGTLSTGDTQEQQGKPGRMRQGSCTHTLTQGTLRC